MGVVWKALDTDLQRFVCIKLIRQEEAGGHHALERFLREARLAARLRHPHIIPVHEVGEVDGKHFLAMDYIDGRCLSSLFDETREAKLGGHRDGHARLRDEVRILADVADAVAYAHGQGVVHRDLKPGNVLLDKSDHAWVIDFGLAKETSLGEEGRARLRTLTMTGQVMGTPAYMSPEQAAGRAAEMGPATDIYALGVMLYEALTGGLPFERGDLLEILKAVIREEPQSPRRRNAHAPAELEAVCLKAMEKERGRRYASAAEVAEELRRWLRGEPVAARRPGVAYRAWRWAARRRRAVVPVAVAVVSLAALGIWGGFSRAKAREDAAARTAAEGRAQQDRESRRRTLKAVHDQVAAAVNDFEHKVMRFPMVAGLQAAFATEKLDLIEMLIRENPEFGALYSWRGKVKEILDDRSGAEADYDRGCALSPDRAVVWYLRGIHRVDSYTRLRILPPSHTGSKDAPAEPPTPETDEMKAWREGGVADLGRMERAAQDELIGNDERQVGLAWLALYRGDAEGREEALSRLAHVAGPRAAYLRGIAHLYRGEYDDAESCYSETLADWPLYDFAWAQRCCARYGKATAMTTAGDDPRTVLGLAYADANQALELAPDWISALSNRGLVRLSLAEAEGRAGGDPRSALLQAIGDFGQALRLDPDHAPAHTKRGAAWIALGRAEAERDIDPRESLRKALADYGRALELQPEDAEALADRGFAWELIAGAEATRGTDPDGSLRKALADFDAALARDPAHSKATNNRAVAWLDVARMEAEKGVSPRSSLQKAIAGLDAAIARDPGLANAHNNRGNARRLLGDAEAKEGGDPRDSYRKAIEDYGLALRLNPEYAEAYYNRGGVWIYFAQAELLRGLDPADSADAAERDLKNAIGRHLPLAHHSLGSLYRATGRLEEAKAEFEVCIRDVPSIAAAARADLERTCAEIEAAKSQPWQATFREAEACIHEGRYARGRECLELGLRQVEESLAALAGEDRTRRMEDPTLRVALLGARYNLACALALASMGKDGPQSAAVAVDPAEAARLRDRAFEELGRAIDLGDRDLQQIEADADFAPLHDDPRWEALLGRIR